MIFYLPWLYDENIEGSGSPRCVAVELALSYPFQASLEAEDGLDIELDDFGGFGVMLESSEGFGVELENEEGMEIAIGGLCSRQ